jgi:hypothetical protein
LSTHLWLVLPTGLFPSGFPTKYPIWIPLLPHSSYMLCLSHPPWLDHSYYDSRGVQVMKLIFMQFSPISRHLISLQTKSSPRTLFSNTLGPCPSLNVRDQVSQPYRTTGKIIVLYILICMFLTADWKTKGSGLNGSKHYPN